MGAPGLCESKGIRRCDVPQANGTLQKSGLAMLQIYGVIVMLRPA
ncbi:hypothetical protein CRENPOLYSF1_290019 [Crenothrix polyspora]|uniref:Uncharacterized protein n=1 Tax=Crenothrix polyspora TaxID=360316 RepID=A0A1R4H8F7_9GAMM|nr:hypothetical protein CRENPOLYSF1_290019 [Crenothrix polyspora]